MLSLNIRAEDRRPLVEQIVGAIRREIDERHLRPGTRIPSIRSFAQQYRVSRFTVVEAYDRLVAMGYLHSRRGAGFYAQAPQPIGELRPEDRGNRDIEQLAWMTRHISEADPNADIRRRRVAATRLARSDGNPPKPQRIGPQKRRTSG